MNTSIFDQLNKLALVEAKVPMTEAEVTGLKIRLFDDKRLNVYPNKFDRTVPYSVRVKSTKSAIEAGAKEWTTHGNFTSIDVAAAVGSLVSLSIYGGKAMRGNYDQAKAEAHPEFAAWLGDERNQAVLAAVGG